MPPDPPSVLAPSALDPIFACPTLNCFRLACYYQWVTVRIILRILITQKHFSFLSRIGCTFRIIHIDIYIFLRAADTSSAQARAYAPELSMKLHLITSYQATLIEKYIMYSGL